MDSADLFIKRMIKEDIQSIIEVDKIYQAYLKFCKRKKLPEENRQHLFKRIRALKNCMISYKKRFTKKDSTCFWGISIKQKNEGKNIQAGREGEGLAEHSKRYAGKE